MSPRSSASWWSRSRPRSRAPAATARGRGAAPRADALALALVVLARLDPGLPARFQRVDRLRRVLELGDHLVERASRDVSRADPSDHRRPLALGEVASEGARLRRDDARVFVRLVAPRGI